MPSIIYEGNECDKCKARELRYEYRPVDERRISRLYDMYALRVADSEPIAWRPGTCEGCQTKVALMYTMLHFTLSKLGVKI